MASVIGAPGPRGAASVQDMMVAYAPASRRQKLAREMTHETFTPTGLHPLDMVAASTAFAPIVGDIAGLAADVRRFAAEPETRTPMNIGLSALGLLPFVPGMFAGKRALTADKALLAQAEKMSGQGRTADEIWKETGWWVSTKEGPNPPGGEPRFEISDQPSRWQSKKMQLRPKGQQTMEDVLHHPELYEAYPGLGMTKLTPVQGLRGEASYTPGEGMQIAKEWAKKASAGKALSAHEMQHAVQGLEGWPIGGGTQELVNLGIRPAVAEDIYKRLAGEAEARATMSRLSMSAERRRQIPPWQSYDVPLQQLIKRYD